MAQFTPETAKAIALELYDYTLSDEAARMVAGGAGAMMSNARVLAALDLTEVEPPFGYPMLLAEAARLKSR